MQCELALMGFQGVFHVSTDEWGSATVTSDALFRRFVAATSQLPADKPDKWPQCPVTRLIVQVEPNRRGRGKVRGNYMLPSTVKNIVLDARSTVRGWSAYKHQTGKLPWLSIVAHSLNWVVIIAGMIFLLWCSGRNRWSRWGFARVLTAVGLPYAFFWSWLKGKVKLNQIRNGRRLARLKALR